MTPYHKRVTAFTQRLTRFWQLTGGAVSDIVADRSADPIVRIPVKPTTTSPRCR